ncbi:MAG: TerD family protein [Bacilli bacterium]|nr:TerD family protein [Bacilli bacterium]
MEGTKFVKAYCNKTHQYYGIEVKKVGSTYKAVDFTFLNDENAKLLTTEVKQDKFYTNDNLISCKKCGSRLIGGCSCNERNHDCKKNAKYDFQCIYCRNLVIDYEEVSEVSGYKEGDVITLSQGQTVTIKFGDGKPLKRIEVGIGWEASTYGSNIDVDSSVVVSGKGGAELVYFGDMTHSSGCVIHHGDNLFGHTGSETQKDDENISVYLTKVPQNRDEITFILNIYECKSRHQKLGIIRNLYLRLFDPDSKKTLIQYKVEQGFDHFTSLIIGKAFRSGADWKFKAIGQGSYATDVRGLMNEVLEKRD